MDDPLVPTALPRPEEFHPTMIDLASIRNASFTLTPTGYNPEEVDRFLADLADHLAEGLAAVPAPEPQPESHPSFEAVPAPVVELPVSLREPVDVDGLRVVIERTIGAMDAFVGNELASLRAATELETEELLHERERMLEEAAAAARAHLDETRTRAEAILAEARRDGDALRARFDSELQADRERFERSLADRDAQAKARAAEILAEAERRRQEADELVASANRVQTQVLASLEHARASLAPATPAAAEPAFAAEAPSPADAGDVFAPGTGDDADPFGNTSDAAA
jgi:DivIVA domain-containing protein